MLQKLSKNDDGDYSYSTQMCALSTDMLKMAISFLVLKFRSTCQKEPRVMLSLAEILYMSIPAILIAIADIIFYYLQTTLRNELVIQAFGSLEIVVIGIASFILLGRSLNGIQWASIMLLCTSVMSIEIGSYDSSSSLLDLPIFPSLLALLCSGLEGTAGVLYEKILKKHNEMNFFHQTMWITFWGSIVHLVFLLFRGWNTFVQSRIAAWNCDHFYLQIHGLLDRILGVLCFSHSCVVRILCHSSSGSSYFFLHFYSEFVDRNVFIRISSGNTKCSQKGGVCSC
ncbi:uncharacterized protein [Blastocystis hominis]|uniref:Uncharacterized protein n=1 Tax=Blastocystis hominis TaxID=12968 RepID=D8M2J0_BLAHO|nr:uncharacterized protein [Blastocystis hominis]CBK22279.2 unnamed protein product [Blastocystis hominis]|eukprot:XP_012896327.1 uncharacterized protein [Blastocystis hominis]